MQDSPLEVKKSRFKKDFEISNQHFERMMVAKKKLGSNYKFPWNPSTIHQIKENDIDFAFADQYIYRFSKLQDTIGAKLIKSFLEFQGESIEEPFLDLLQKLEKIKILRTETWFQLREVRNEIAHEHGLVEKEKADHFNRIAELESELNFILNQFRLLGKL